MAKVKNDNWVERLKSADDTRDQAITELTNILLRGLTATCRNRYGNKVQPEDVVQDALIKILDKLDTCLLYTSPSPRDQRGSRMPSSA